VRGQQRNISHDVDVTTFHTQSQYPNPRLIDIGHTRGQLWSHIQLRAGVQGGREQMPSSSTPDRLCSPPSSLSHSGWRTAHTCWISFPKKSYHLEKWFSLASRQLEGWLLDGSVFHFEILVQLGKRETRLVVHTQNVINIDQDVGPIMDTIIRPCVTLHLQISVCAT
jgi:hypothetical protein